MEIACQEYELQIEKAKQTVKMLEERISAIKIKLDKQPDDPLFQRELKKLELDMKITVNELEHAQSELESCMTKTKTTSKRR